MNKPSSHPCIYCDPTQPIVRLCWFHGCLFYAMYVTPMRHRHPMLLYLVFYRSLVRILEFGARAGRTGDEGQGGKCRSTESSSTQRQRSSGVTIRRDCSWCAVGIVTLRHVNGQLSEECRSEPSILGRSLTVLVQFRKLRSGSPQPPELPRNGAPTKPSVQTQSDGGGTIPISPTRSKTEPKQTRLLLHSGETDDEGRRFSDTSVASSTLPILPRRYTSIEGNSDDPMGLTFIHGTSEPTADIIFVHGLGGSSIRTWSWERNPQLFWPSWLLDEKGLANFRVFSYGYNANFRNSENPLSIMDFSRGLLIGMKTYGRGDSDDIGMVSVSD